MKSAVNTSRLAAGCFIKELCKGFNPKAAAKTLVKAKMIEPGKDRIQQKKRINALAGSTFNFYVLTPFAVGAVE